jgi:hypothetical protein
MTTIFMVFLSLDVWLEDLSRSVVPGTPCRSVQGEEAVGLGKGVTQAAHTEYHRGTVVRGSIRSIRSPSSKWV